MILAVQINRQTYKIDAAGPLHISIPLDFDGAQPNAYGVEKATTRACETGDLVGDTRRGGSCNFEQVKFIPHCSGTHTECVGHITRERISVHDCLKDALIPAVLISVAPENAAESGETYAVGVRAADEFITRRALENALRKLENDSGIPNENFLRGLIVRTLPNDEDKKARAYLEDVPPFFSTEAMRFIQHLNTTHLLVDLPSVDRLFDEGKLSNHRIFWSVPEASFAANEKTGINRTITELIYAPDAIADGKYLLNLQIAPFASDASPSRPVLFKILD